MKQLVMETHYHSRTDAVCQLSEVDASYMDGVGKVVWGCFFDPTHDGSIDRMSDERDAFLKANDAEIVWPDLEEAS
jgi:hypothetical protein